MGAAEGSIRPTHSRPRVLADLVTLVGFESSDTVDGIEITGVTSSSADVLPGDIFVAIPGATTHGARFAKQAQQAGAVAIVTDSAGQQIAHQTGVEVPVLCAEDIRAVFGELAKWVYRTDEISATVFGVTGTNGKTSVIYLLDALLSDMAVSTGLSTTAERRVGSQRLVSGLTTPEASDVHALLARMQEEHIQAALLEVSAQALSRHRVDGVFFDVVGFTNLSHDHFDDYSDFDAYFEAKAQLFSPERARQAVVFIDDEWGRRLAAEARIPVVTISGTGQPQAQWQVEVSEVTPTLTTFRLTGPEGRELLTSVNLMGRFMAHNAALAIVMLVESGIEFERITHVLTQKSGIHADIPGRSEIVSGAEGPVFYVDYGHTPDAFEELLTSARLALVHADSARSTPPSRIIFVFGADGDRDTTKREQMGLIAGRGADVVIVTDFHPRTEDPALIRAALLRGAHSAHSAAEICEIPTPELAVREAIARATADDVIIYAGPGHEDYREVDGVHLPYSARDDVRAALAEAGYPPRSSSGENSSQGGLRP